MYTNNINTDVMGIIDYVDQLIVIDRPKRSISHRLLYLSLSEKYRC